MVVRRRRCRPAIKTPDSRRAIESRVWLQNLGQRVRQLGRELFGPAIAPSSGCDQVEDSFAVKSGTDKPANAKAPTKMGFLAVATRTARNPFSSIRVDYRP